MDLKALAKLSDVHFSEQEFFRLEKDFKNALERVAPILNVKPPDVMIYATPISISELRNDVIKPSLSIEKVFKCTKNKRRDRYFVVPQVVE